MFKLLFTLLLLAFGAAAQNPEVNRYITEARKALANKDYPVAYEQLTKAHAFHPYHQGILYQLGVTSAAIGRADESIGYLRQALHVNAAYKLDIPELASVKDRPDFQKLLTLQNELNATVVRSDTAFVLTERSIHAESVAVDPKTGTCFIGGVHGRKIVAVDAKGNNKDLTKPGEHGLTAVLGLRMDPDGRSLWACSSPMEEMANYDSLAPSKVIRLEIQTGKLLAQFELPGKHVFGDMVIGPDKQVFVSDSRTNEIYKVNEKSGKLDLFFADTEFWNIQGLTFSSDGKYLFVSDYIKGPYRLELSTRKLLKIKSNVENSLKGIDGMLFYEGTLIVLQNGTAPFRAMRFTLNGAQDTIVKAEIIDQGHPALNEPTQGTIVGNTLYYVANSQWGGYDQKRQIKLESELQDIVILRFDF